MVKLDSILSQVLHCVKTKHPRFTIIDKYHVMDNTLGLEYHMEDGYLYKVTKGDDVILTGEQMTRSEADILKALAYELPNLYADTMREDFYVMAQAEEPIKEPDKAQPLRY